MINKKKNLDTIKQELINRQQELESRLSTFSQDITPDTSQDPADQASLTAFETLKNSLHDNEYEEHRMITKALQMIQDGTYGICADCQEAISEKRLKSFPNATRCLLCQEIAEESSPKNNF